jgi:hypothetical protein
VTDSEWASDVMFRSHAALEKIYPRLLHHAVSTFGAVEVLRFLGQPILASGKIPHRCRHEVVTNLTSLSLVPFPFPLTKRVCAAPYYFGAWPSHNPCSFPHMN